MNDDIGYIFFYDCLRLCADPDFGWWICWGLCYSSWFKISDNFAANKRHSGMSL